MALPPTAATWVDGPVDAADLNADLRDVLEWMLSPPRILALRTSHQSLPNATVTAVQLPAESYKSGFTHSTVTNTRALTVDVDGLYVVYGNIEITESAGGGQRRVELCKNGTTDGTGGTIFARDNSARLGTPNFLAISGMVRAVAGDFFQMLAYQSSGGSLNIGSSTSLAAYFAKR